MQPATLETAQARYTAAYEAYQRASRRVAEKLKNGLVPTGEEVAQEAAAAEALGAARRTLMDAIANAAPAR